MQRHSSASGAARVPPGGLTRNQAARVLEYIESNLSGELALTELAGIAGLSLHHFARMFKRTIGAAPHRYVLERRVERAKAMLRTSGASLAEISFSTGFCSQSHLTNTFRRMLSATPTEYQGCSR
jgi:AraC family transcriptional regulator